jgi:hypothetical protein
VREVEWREGGVKREEDEDEDEGGSGREAWKEEETRARRGGVMGESSPAEGATR